MIAHKLAKVPKGLSMIAQTLAKVPMPEGGRTFVMDFSLKNVDTSNLLIGFTSVEYSFK
jgi:hypothetical protein